MQFTENEFESVKLKAEEVYKKIGEIRCPFLDERVVFNEKGLEHLGYKNLIHRRNKADQFIRLKLLHLAPLILKKSHTLQGTNSENILQRVKRGGKWQSEMVHVIYYEFIGIIDNCRLKIIVKKINNSQPYFWSIIPYWKQVGNEKKMFEGILEED